MAEKRKFIKEMPKKKTSKNVSVDAALVEEYERIAKEVKDKEIGQLPELAEIFEDALADAVDGAKKELTKLLKAAA